MPIPPWTRSLAALLLAAICAVAAAQMEPPSVYELPGEAVFPEGIVYHEASGTFFVSGAMSGAIYRGDPESGEVEVFAQASDAPFTAIGLSTDAAGRLWVAGGSSGTVYALDIATGERLATYTTPEAEATFMNDVVVAPSGDVYATDSNRPILFRIPASDELSDGEAEVWLDVTGTAFEMVEGINANGIVATPDGRYLIVVQMATGLFYRIDADSKEVVEIDLGGETLVNGDGLVLDGSTLYVVRNGNQQVGVVELADDLASGTVQEPITADTFSAPATAALVGDALLVTNSQFPAMQSEDGPDLPFTVSRVELP